MLTIAQAKDLIQKCEKALHEPRDPEQPETKKIVQQLERAKSTLANLEERIKK